MIILFPSILKLRMKPIILDFCTQRKEDQGTLFYYNNNLNLNVVKVNEKEVPFVNLKTNNLELMTKTDIAREADDDNILDLMTKTKAEREQDDDSFFPQELMTKTKVHREQDEGSLNLLELQTKTFTDREQDDNDPIYY
jgi:hypothetical protein